MTQKLSHDMLEPIGPFSGGVIPDNATLNEALQALVDASGTGSTTAVINQDVFEGNGVQTVFALSANPGSLQNLDVTVGALRQYPGDDYTWVSGTNLTFIQAPPDGEAILVRSIQAYDASLIREELDDLKQSHRTLLDGMPKNIRDAVIAGTNTSDLAPYINTAIANGGIFDTLDLTYQIGSRLVPGIGTTLVGKGTFQALPTFSDTGAGDGMNMLCQVVSGLEIEEGITFDGNSITTANFWLYGLRNKTGVNNVKLDCTVKNVSFTGIDISRGGGAYTNTNITVRGHAENCGWSCVNLEGITNLDHTGLSAFRSGWHAIYVAYCNNVNGPHTFARKSIPPYRIYNGPGSAGGVEKGFLFGHFSVKDAIWTDIQLHDNRNALEDGFGIGEDGSISDPESSNIYVTGQIYDAGQFGFDVSSNMRADIQVFRSLKQGVQFGFDLGGTLANVAVKASVYDVVEDEAVRFSATGPAVRSCATTSGSDTITINSGTGFYTVPGQKITGAGIPANAFVGSINGSTVKMVTTETGTTPALATATAANASLTFRGIINFVNCNIDIVAVNCPYGAGIESGANGYATYTNCEITGDLSQVTTASVNLLNGDYPSGMRVKASKWKTDWLAKNGSAFTPVGHNRFSLNSGGQLNAINGGYDWQDIEVLINVTDTILNFDWTNSSGYGDTKLIGNGNVDILLKAGSSFRATKRPGVGWYVYGISHSSALPEAPIGPVLQGVLDLQASGAKMAVVVGDYNSTTGLGTDDGPAILQQLQTLSAAGGGKLIIPYGKKPFVGSSFEMPQNTGIEFEKVPTGTHDGLQLPNLSGTIWLSSAATITMANATSLKANLFRAGWKPGLTSAQITSTFLGTAIILKTNCANISIEGMIIGFLKSIESQNTTNTDGTAQNNRLDLKVIVDCINGPHIHNCYDISRLNGVHCWPFSSVTSPAETDGAQLKRAGYALWLSGVNDWTMVFQYFSYGYMVGIRLTDCSAVTLNNCGMDHVPGAADGSIGYLLEGNTREIKLQSVQAAGKEFGIIVNSTTPSGRLAAIITAPTVWVTKTVGIDIIAGSVQINGGSIRNDPLSPNGIGVRNRNTGSAEVTLNGVDFCGLTTGIDNGSASAVLRYPNCTFRAVSTQIVNAYMPTLASGASVAPNGVDTVFNLTGTTNVGNISSPQRYAGRMVTFICVGGLQFLFGGNIITRSGVNTAVGAGRAFSVVSDGTNWYEV